MPHWFLPYQTKALGQSNGNLVLLTIKLTLHMPELALIEDKRIKRTKHLPMPRQLTLRTLVLLPQDSHQLSALAR